MKNLAVVKKGMYFDSVTLMGVSKRLLNLDGVEKVSVSMGTELNQDLLRDAQMNTPETDAATPNDLMIVLRYNDDLDSEVLLEQIEKELSRKPSMDAVGGDVIPSTVRTALSAKPNGNLVVLSVPGQYAAYEAMNALRQGLHVMMFSDNVSVEDEIHLKQYAHEKGLLMMGPDCGTAIINQTALCFANVVQNGPVGVVGASGTGTQEVTCLLDAAGVGISQAIGTGGRDLSEAVGATMTIDALHALDQDPTTKILLVVAKAPDVSVMDKLVNEAKQLTKEVVFCFLSPEKYEDQEKISFANTLEEAVLKVLSKLDVNEKFEVELPNKDDIDSMLAGLQPTQKYLRGVFCGGTLTNEARMIFKQICPDFPVLSNISHEPSEQLTDPNQSSFNALIDMGDDLYTKGRAHPMIDPELRNLRLLQEALDPETAVVLFDLVLGYGANEDPLTPVLSVIEKAQQELSAQNRKVNFIGYVLGTDGDPQNRSYCIERLKQAGVVVAKTNAQAARIAAQLIKEVK